MHGMNRRYTKPENILFDTVDHLHLAAFRYGSRV
jgi:hypothetical protein